MPQMHRVVSREASFCEKVARESRNSLCKILEELEYGEGDMVWYSGYDTISYSPKQLFTAAEYALKLCAVPVAISGEETLMNSGSEQMMDLLEKREEVFGQIYYNHIYPEEFIARLREAGEL